MNLFIDTTSTGAIIGLGAGDKLMDWQEWPNGPDLSQTLQGEMDKILARNHVAPLAVICVTGPGSFTSIRVGVSVANAYAFAKNIPISPMSRFEIYEHAATAKGPRVVLLNNIKDLVYAKLYLAADCEYFVGTMPELDQKLSGHEDFVYMGEFESDLEKRDTTGDGQMISGEKRARLILQAGEKALIDLDCSKFRLPIKPLYINKPNITRPKKRK